MANINVQRKSGAASAAWWIIGLVVVALIVWMLVGWGDPDTVGLLSNPSGGVMAEARPVQAVVMRVA